MLVWMDGIRCDNNDTHQIEIVQCALFEMCQQILSQCWFRAMLTRAIPTDSLCTSEKFSSFSWSAYVLPHYQQLRILFSTWKTKEMRENAHATRTSTMQFRWSNAFSSFSFILCHFFLKLFAAEHHQYTELINSFHTHTHEEKNRNARHHLIFHPFHFVCLIF